MSILKNRTVLGVVCIALALVISFALTPLFNSSLSHRTDIVRVTGDIRAGERITDDVVQTVAVGGYNLPDNVVRHLDAVLGKYAAADLAAGDYILASKLTDSPAAANAYLYRLTGEKQAISITIKSFAVGLSGKLISGDIVSVIAPDYRKMGATVIPAELRYVEVIGVTAGSGVDTDAGGPEDERELPSTVTLLVSPEQSKILAELEADGKLHLSLVYRGSREVADQFIDAQDQALEALYPPVTEETAETWESGDEE